jgi:toxin FitB
MWLLDTNVISELRKSRPDAKVMSWVVSQRSESLHASEVCFAEIRAGIKAQTDSDKVKQLDIWFEETVSPMFLGRILPVSRNVLVNWLELIGRLHAGRNSAPPADVLIAATATHHAIQVATRDTGPFVACGVPVLNPWTGERFNGA